MVTHNDLGLCGSVVCRCIRVVTGASMKNQLFVWSLRLVFVGVNPFVDQNLWPIFFDTCAGCFHVEGPCLCHPEIRGNSLDSTTWWPRWPNESLPGSIWDCVAWLKSSSVRSWDIAGAFKRGPREDGWTCWISRLKLVNCSKLTRTHKVTQWPFFIQIIWKLQLLRWRFVSGSMLKNSESGADRLSGWSLGKRRTTLPLGQTNLMVKTRMDGLAVVFSFYVSSVCWQPLLVMILIDPCYSSPNLPQSGSSLENWQLTCCWKETLVTSKAFAMFSCGNTSFSRLVG